MKKILPIISLLFVALLFNGCSTDEDKNEDTATFVQIHGKWKLTAYTDNAGTTTPIANGYVIEFNADKSFISDEENGYTGGSYRVTKEPGKNLQLIYKKQWADKAVYKYINAIYDENMFVQASSNSPTEEGATFSGNYVLTRIP